MPVKVSSTVKDAATLTRNISSLHHKLEDVVSRLERVERRLGMYREPVAVQTEHVTATQAARPVAAKVTKDTSNDSLPSLPHIDNLGFKLFGAIGFLFIILGLYYLYSWAVERGLLSPLARIAMGVAASLLIVVVSEGWIRKKYEQFASVLTGGSIALLYFTVYATYYFSTFRTALGMSLLLNTMLLLLVAGTGVWLSLRIDSKFFTGFAFFLAYTTSFLPGGHQSLIAAMITSVALWLVLIHKQWRFSYIPVLAAYFVFFNQAATLDRYNVAPWAFLLYLAILFVLFVVLSIVYDAHDDTVALAVAVENGLFSFLIALSVLTAYYPTYKGVFAFLFAALHILLWLIADAQKLPRIANTFLVLAAGLTIVAIPIQLDNAWVTILWSVEGALLVLLGMKYNRIGLRVSGYAALVIASITALAYDSWQLTGGERTVTFAILLVALIFVTWLLHQRSDLLKMGMTAPYIASMTTAMMLTLLLAIDMLSRGGVLANMPLESRLALLSVAWLLAGIVAFGWGTRSSLPSIQLPGVCLLAIATAKVLIVDGSIDFGMRTLAYVFAIVTLGVASYLLIEKERTSKRPDYQYATIGAVVTVLVLVTALAVELLDARGMLHALDLTVRHVILSSVWALLSIALVAAGFAYGSKAVRVTGLVLFGITMAKVLLFDLGNIENVYRVVVTIFIGLLALGGSFAYVKNRDRLEQLAKP